MSRFFKFLSTCFGIAILLVATNAHAQSITLFNGSQFSGGSRTLTGSVSHLGSLNFNNKASSVRVGSGRWELCAATGFGGRCIIVDDDIPGLGAFNLNDRISSVRFLPPNTSPPPSPPPVPPSGPVAPTPPPDREAANFAAPSDLTIADTAAGLRFSWLDNSNNEEGFIIERRLPMTSSWSLFGTTNYDPNSSRTTGPRALTKSNQRAGVGICYRVRATRGRNRSAPTSIVCSGLN